MHIKEKMLYFLFILLLICCFSSSYGCKQKKKGDQFDKHGQENTHTYNQIDKELYIQQAHILFEQGKLMDSIRQYARAVCMDSDNDNTQFGFIDLFSPRVHQLRYSQFGPQSKEEVEFIAFYIRTVEKFNFLSQKKYFFHFFIFCGLFILIGVLGDTIISLFFSKLCHKKTK